MDTYQFWTLVGLFGGALVWIIGRQEVFIYRVEKRFEKNESKVEGLGNRINCLETEISGVKAMLQTIVGFLLGNKTG